jgi:hypothetical protein
MLRNTSKLQSISAILKICNFFILFQLHVVQFEISFDTHAEIYLIFRK